MQELVYQVSFNTPAFLGNADQQAQWRTPPFKALIRQWWRVAQKARTATDTQRMRHDEGMQFGNAWLTDADSKPLHRKSDLLVRLAVPSEHSMGTLSTEGWQQFEFDRVPTSRDATLRADLYTGYGPVQSERVRGVRRITIERGAIDVDKAAQLRLGAKEPLQRLEEALQLMHWFGTIGSRSRNGWGSLRLVPENDGSREFGLRNAHELAARFGRPWRECRVLDWPHAIGSDDSGPLVWLTEELADWRAAIGRLARIRIAVRLASKRIRDPDSKVGAIHFLGYPAGTGPSNPWTLVRPDAPEPRLASPLRFKVVRSGVQVRALVFHMPARLPDAFLSAVGSKESAWLAQDRNWLDAWEVVHRVLDNNEDPMVPGKPLGIHRLGHRHDG